MAHAAGHATDACAPAVLAGQDRRLRDFAPAAVRGALRGYVDSL